MKCVFMMESGDFTMATHNLSLSVANSGTFSGRDLMIVVVLNDHVAIITACVAAGPIPKHLSPIETQTVQNDIQERV